MTFHEALLKVGKVHSLLQENVHIMALTASTTHALILELTKVIGMKSPVMIALPPCKPNTMYKVRTYTSIEHDFMPILEQLQRERVEFPRTIIYCRQMKEAQIYTHFFSMH